MAWYDSLIDAAKAVAPPLIQAAAVAVPAYLGTKAIQKGAAEKQQAATAGAENMSAAYDRAAQLAKEQFDATMARNAPTSLRGNQAGNELAQYLLPGGYGSEQAMARLMETGPLKAAIAEQMRAMGNQYSSRSRGAGGLNNPRTQMAMQERLLGRTILPYYQNNLNNLGRLYGEGNNANQFLGSTGDRFASQVGGYGVNAAGGYANAGNVNAESSASARAGVNNILGQVANQAGQMISPDPARRAMDAYYNSMAGFYNR